VHGESGYTTVERTGIRPTLDVNGIWGGYTGEGAKTVLPSKANAKISMRLVPNQDSKEISAMFEKHFKSIAPKSTGVYGTYVLLEAAKRFGLERYHQISTDEVYGHIPHGHSSVETDKLAPRSPYAASKASGDLLVNAYHITYGLPVTLTRGSNNIGPFQFPEKVVPLFATNALDDKQLPVYGDGRQMREYQYVVDHCEAIDLVLHKGIIGEVYNIGTGYEMENLRMIEILLDALEKPRSLIRHVEDRPGHDRRYSLNIGKIQALGWQPRHTAEEAIAKTAVWYKENEWWWRKIKEKESYKAYYETQYGKRLETSGQ
jgi:dTDP-glucose 4,6-dehydratase